MWEIGGWLLVVISLLLFFSVYDLLVSREPRIFEVGPLTIIGIVVFRGGIHLLKVGAAARACQDLHERLRETKHVPPRDKGRP
jgi:hypothetical protein